QVWSLMPRSTHSLVGFTQYGQSIATGKDEILHAGVAQFSFPFAGPSCQIDMLGARCVKGLCGGDSLVGIELVGGTQAGEACAGRLEGGGEGGECVGGVGGLDPLPLRGRVDAKRRGGALFCRGIPPTSGSSR